MQDALLTYHKAGIPLIRIEKGTKRPIDPGWNDKTDDDFNDIMDKFSSDDYNVGGVIGRLYGRDMEQTLVFDFDNPEYWVKLTNEDQEFQDLLLNHAPVVHTPSGGKHVWVRVSSTNPVSKWTFQFKGEPAGEVLGYKSMALLPPSIVDDKKSGNGMAHYEVVSGDWNNIPLVSLRLVEKWFPKMRRKYIGTTNTGPSVKIIGKDPVSSWPQMEIVSKQEETVTETGPIAHATQTILNAPIGQINNSINDMSFFLGRSEDIPVEESRAALQNAVIKKLGHPEEKAFGTIERGLEAGKKVGPPVFGSTPMADEDIIAKAKEAILDRNKSHSSEMDLQYLPSVLQDYVYKATQGTMISPTIVAMSLLTTISAYMGKKAKFRYFEMMRANIWTLVFAGSGTGKSSALNIGSKLFEIHDNDVFDEIAHHHSQKQLASKEQKANIDEMVLKLEASLMRYSNRVSFDAFYELLTRKENGGAFMIDEFSAFLKNMCKGYNEGMLNELTSFYNTFHKDSKTTKNTGILQLKNPYVSKMGISTEEFIGELLTPNDVFSGFLARFMMFSIPSSDAIPPSLPVQSTPFELSAEYAEMKMVVQKINLIQDDIEMKLHHDAKVWFEDAHTMLWEQQQNEKDEFIKSLLEAFCKRWSPGIIKLAMILEWIQNPGSDTIGTDAMRGAIYIICHSANCTVGLYRGSLGGSSDERMREQMLLYISKQGGAVRCGSLKRDSCLKRVSQGKDPKQGEYDEIMNSLVDTNHLNITKIEDGVKLKKAQWIVSLNQA